MLVVGPEETMLQRPVRVADDRAAVVNGPAAVDLLQFVEDPLILRPAGGLRPLDEAIHQVFVGRIPARRRDPGNRHGVAGMELQDLFFRNGNVSILSSCRLIR